MNKQTDSYVFKRLTKEQKISQKELSNIIKDITRSVNEIKKVSRKTPQEIEQLSEGNNAELAKSSLKETVNNLENQKPYEAMDASYSSMQSMQSLE